jgi:uncharacterized protein YdeI (YjbR/CyaY-like superfamily)
MGVTFQATLLQAEGMNATGIQVPAEVLAALGGQKRAKVVVQFNNYSYHTTLGSMNGMTMISVSAEHRTAAGLKAGDTLEVTLELDQELRTIAIPEDLATALAAQPGASAAFDALAFSIRKEHVRQVETAKAAETRARRIASIVAKLITP